MAKEKNTEKVREIAKIVAKNPKTAAVVGCALKDAANHVKQYKSLYKLLIVLCLEQQEKYEMAIKVVSCNDDIEKIIKLHEKIRRQLINPERVDSLFAEEVNWD